MNKHLFFRAISVVGILFTAQVTLAAEELKAESKQPSAAVHTSTSQSAADIAQDSLWAHFADLHRDSIGESLSAPAQTTLFAQSNSEQSKLQTTR